MSCTPPLHMGATFCSRHICVSDTKKEAGIPSMGFIYIKQVYVTVPPNQTIPTIWAKYGQPIG